MALASSLVQEPRPRGLTPLSEAPAERELPFNPRIARAIAYMVEHYQEQPSLEAMAERAGLSTFHFQRMFKRWAGISPKRFLQYVTLAHAKRLLAGDASVLDAALDTGLSGPSRLHDLFVSCEAMTPGEFKALGEQLVIRWGLHDGPLGRVLLGATERGVCWLSFAPEGRRRGDRGVRARMGGRAARARPGRDGRSRRPRLRAQRGCRTSAAPAARHQLPDQGLGSAAAGALRPAGELRDNRPGDRPARAPTAPSAARSAATTSPG